MDYPILYSFRRCPYAMRARLVLFSADEPFILREILLRDKPEAFVAASAKATVPVLCLPNGTIIDESINIIRYFFAHWQNKHNKPHPWDTGENTNKNTGENQKDIDAFINNFETAFKTRSDGYKYGESHTAKEQNFSAACEFLKSMETRLSAYRYLFGDNPSIADIVALPFIRQFAKVDEARFAKLPLPNLQNRLDEFLNCKLFQEIMQKFPAWNETDPNDYGIKITPTLPPRLSS